MLKIGNKKLINAWAFYDWANSVYSLVIGTAVFPLYYSAVTDGFLNDNKKIIFLGTEWNPTVLYDYTLAFSFLIVAFISPILSGIADFTGNKLGFLKRFCLLGSLSVMSLYFFKDENTLWIALVFTILASVGFWGSIVFYNAYLPEVALPEQQDSASAKGFIYGYVGSVLLLVVCLAAIMLQETGEGKLQMMRYSFIVVGLWWVGFAQITYKRLPNTIIQKNYNDKSYLWKGFNELKQVLKEIKEYPRLKIFLTSFFFFSIGVQTIILMAGIFGSKELGLPSQNLILAIILVQLIAIVGAWLFSKISAKKGNLFALRTAIIIWMLVCFTAFMLDKNQKGIHVYFYGMAGLIGLVMGAIQSLSRSTYSKLLPETKDHTTYFSFYDVTEKIAIVVGMVAFGVLIALTGSMQWSVLSLGAFFLISLLVLSSLKKTKYVR